MYSQASAEQPEGAAPDAGEASDKKKDDDDDVVDADYEEVN